MTARTGLILDRVARAGPTRVVQLGLGDPDLAVALATAHLEYLLVEPSTQRASDALARRPDLRRRCRTRMAGTLGRAALGGGPDAVVVDLAAPSLSTTPLTTLVPQLSAALRAGGTVLLANLRDPRVERLLRWAGDGAATSTADAAGWSPPALTRALLTLGVPAHVYPPLGTAAYDALLGRAAPTGSGPPLRWGRELGSTSHLARLLATGRVDRARVVGVPVAATAEALASWQAHLGRQGRRPGAGVRWSRVRAIAAEHGYEATPVASLTAAEHHFDVVLERVAPRDTAPVAPRQEISSAP
ncbi:hypothetical protein [Actinosynnema pretiosum]|uniref:Uncharacterized protein n=1 Tax=Actinosynnema pretiosum TaxID=42197 RepID=A0A290Z7J0_9PSEU|nr:hypothetical protein [Actinosynnema pretiosum]ATE54997.1 hypothetical protein CNX65_18310 [Actinosynnema pretiosum]